MNSQRSWSVVLGVAAGALTFVAMNVCAQRGVFSVADILGDPGKFYGREVPVSGLVSGVRFSNKTVNYKTREQVEYASFYLYEADPKGYRGQGKHYVSVSVPSGTFGMNRPKDGEMFTMTGPLSAPFSIGRIEPEP